MRRRALNLISWILQKSRGTCWTKFQLKIKKSTLSTIEKLCFPLCYPWLRYTTSSIAICRKTDFSGRNVCERRACPSLKHGKLWIRSKCRFQTPVVQQILTSITVDYNPAAKELMTRCFPLMPHVWHSFGACRTRQRVAVVLTLVQS